jgi:Ca2+-binding RTX toxin-like protein
MSTSTRPKPFDFSTVSILNPAVPGGTLIVSDVSVDVLPWTSDSRIQSGMQSGIQNGGDRNFLPPSNEVNEVKGTNQADTLRGTRLPEVFYGRDGDDRLWGAGGDDIMYGEQGDDLLSGSVGNDTLFGGEGSDVLRGGSGGDNLQGDLGNDILVGGGGRDLFNVQGIGGRDVIRYYVDGVDLFGISDFDVRGLQIVQQGKDTALRLGNRTLAIVQNVQAGLITREDFAVATPVPLTATDGGN